MTSTSGAQSQVLPRKSVHSIILDTSPILNSTPPISTLLAKCEKLYTVSAVIDEVKDVNARSRLEFMILPFLTIRNPKPESIKFVSDFSRKTGDYVVLSKPDIQVLALAYELECEQNGGDWNLRKAPGQKGLNGSSPKPNDTAIEGSDDRKIPLSDSRTSFATEESHVPTEPSVATKNDLQPPTRSYPAEVDAKQITTAFEGLQIVESDPTKSNLESNHGESLDSSISNPADVESESDDSDGWITPSNLKKQQARDENTSMVPLPRDQVMQVATITGDFAMQVRTGLILYALDLIVRPQNVLLQIGLSLLSSSLQSVKNIRTYILRCHACFEKVKGKLILGCCCWHDLANTWRSDMSKQFCPRCGTFLHWLLARLSSH